MRGQKSRKDSLVDNRKIPCSAPDHVYRRNKQTEVCEKSENTSGNKPVEHNVVRTIKPLLLRIHTRIVMLIENIIKILLTPAKYRSLLKSLHCHCPYIVSTLALQKIFIKADLRETTKGITLMHKLRM